MKKLLFLTLSTFFVFSCNNNKKTVDNINQLIPETSQVILSTNNVNSLKSSLKNNAFFQAQSKTDLYKTLENRLEVFSSLNTQNPVLFSFENTDSLQITLITKLKDSLFLAEVDSTKVYKKIIDSIYIGSTSKQIIDKLKINQNSTFSNLLASTNDTKSLSIVINPTLAQQLGRSLLNLNEPLSDCASFDFEIEQNQILIHGVLKHDDSTSQTLNRFSKTIPQENTLKNIIPNDIENFTSVSFDDYLELTAANPDSTQLEFYQTANQIGKLTLNGNDAYIFDSIDEIAMADFLKNHIQDSYSFRNTEIFNLSDSEFLDREFNLIEIDSLQNFAQIDSFFVFSNSTETLESIISNHQNGNVMSSNHNFSSMYENLSDESSIFLIKNNTELENTFNSLFNMEDAVVDSKYKTSTFQFIKDDEFTHFNGVIKKASSRAASNTITEEFSISLDNDILTNPQFVKNYRTKEKDIIVQDINNNLYLISNKGKVLWKKQLNGKVLGNIEQVDLYKNGRLQFAFATQKRFYVLDRNGKNVSNFPVKFNDDITQPLSVFDYDKKRNYRFLITQGKEVLMLDKNAKTVKGFKFKKHKDIISSQPKHFRIQGKDFIVFSAGKELVLLNRRGETRLKVNEQIEFSENEIYSHKNQFTTTNTKGELIQVNLRGKLSKQGLALDSKHKIDASSKTLTTLSENKLTVKNNQYELDFGNYTAPKIFYINDKIYVALTDLQTKKVHLFDSNAKLQSNFPVYGNSSIDLANFDKDRNLEFVVISEPNTFIVYQKN